MNNSLFILSVNAHVDLIRRFLQKKYNRRVFAWVERVFRGRRDPKLILLFSASYKPDYRLIPKDEEEAWYERLKECKKVEKIYDPYMQLPPLLNVIFFFF